MNAKLARSLVLLLPFVALVAGGCKSNPVTGKQSNGKKVLRVARIDRRNDWFVESWVSTSQLATLRHSGKEYTVRCDSSTFTDPARHTWKLPCGLIGHYVGRNISSSLTDTGAVTKKEAVRDAQGWVTSIVAELDTGVMNLIHSSPSDMKGSRRDEMFVVVSVRSATPQDPGKP